MVSHVKRWVCDFFGALFGPDSPYLPGVIIWTWYTAFFSFALAVSAWINEDGLFNSIAYDWVRDVMPLKVWSVIWLIPVFYHFMALITIRTPFYAAKQFRRQLGTFVFIQGIWMISILVLTLQGQVGAITASLVWLGNTIASLALLHLTPLYKPGVAGFNRVNYTHKSTSWRRFAQW